LLAFTTCANVDPDSLAGRAARPTADGERQDAGWPATETTLAPIRSSDGFQPTAKGRVRPENRLINKALSMSGIPAVLPETAEQLEKIGQPPEPVQLSVADRRLRNPDGSYGPQSSTVMGDFDAEQVQNAILSQAVSAGSAALNTWAEGWLSGFGRAKVDVRPSFDGDVTGSIDFLSPIYDNQSMTFFSQFGVRTMPGERIIGNMGLGHRLLWDTTAVGYNLFMDQDFTRGHLRGGFGLELWYDWLRLSSNYYSPLSKWQASRDLDGRYVQERPAEGWDARLTSYLPFYRQLAVKAAVEEWFGEYVGAFGKADRLYKNPKVVVAGLEWTPAPIVSLSGETRSTKDHTETKVGLTLNYFFGVPLKEQLVPANVAEFRSIDGSRHDFVNRQNDMILEYRATPGRYLIKVLKDPRTNVFNVYVTDFFGKPIRGLNVRVRS
jgi:hypothetical protein